MNVATGGNGIACNCTGTDCWKFGCKMFRNCKVFQSPEVPPAPWPREAISPNAPVQRGCICPPTSEQTCKAPLCPRQPIDTQSHSTHREK